MKAKKMFKLFSLALVLSVAFVGCRRTDVRDFTVTVPSMTQEDVSIIKEALSVYGGVDQSSLKFDLASRTVKMKYDSMQLAKKNIEMAIAKKGLEANGVTPESVGEKRKKH
jgi:copper chaperone CopZ